MLKKHSTRTNGAQFPPPLVIDNTNKWRWTATGTREQLLEARLCTPAHFPAGKKRQNYGDDNGRDWRIKYVKGGYWTLTIYRTEEERDLFNDAAETEKEIKGLPVTADEWRGRALAFADDMLEAIRYSLTCGPLSKTGHSFNAEGMRVLEAQLSRVRIAVASLPITFNEAVRTESLRDLRCGQNDGAMPKLRAPLVLAIANGGHSNRAQ